MINNADKVEEISTHAAGSDALIMLKDIPHAVYGEEKFKMLLVVLF